MKQTLLILLFILLIKDSNAQQTKGSYINKAIEQRYVGNIIIIGGLTFASIGVLSNNSSSTKDEKILYNSISYTGLGIMAFGAIYSSLAWTKVIKSQKASCYLSKDGVTFSIQL